MENVIHRITLDLTGPDMCPMIEVQRGDSARSLIISLTQGGRPYWIDEGLTAALFATKPDGNPLFNACTIEKNRVRYDFTPQTANVAGAFDCEIWLVAGDKRELTTPRFTIAVDERMRTDDVIPESEPEYTAITEMVAAGTAMIEELREALAGLEGVEEILTQARAAMEDAEAAASHAADSEAAAKGHARTAAKAAEDALTLAAQANSASQQSNKYAFEALQHRQAAEAAAKEAKEAAANLPQGGGNGSGQNLELDSSLTKSGKAADAKATGDEIKRVEGKIPSIEGLAKSEEIPKVPNWAMQSSKPSYTASEVGALPSTYTPPNQTAEQVGADPKGTAASAVNAHNTSTDAHPDLRLEIQAIREQLAAFLDVDKETLNELSELIALIVANQTRIEQLTTGKVSVSDIIDNLTTNVANKPLSAAQGVVIKGLIDGLSTGKLDASKVSEAINTALAQAKARGEFDGAKGDPGRGIKSIARTSGNGAAGTTDTYTITYTDNTTSTFTVRNGSNGTAGKTATLEITSVTALPPGAAPTVTEVEGSTEQARRYALAIPQGAPGGTPRREIDYWTPADREAIVQQVIAALGTPVFGRVDEDCKITLTGALTDGKTYTFAYVDEDGGETVIGTYTKAAPPAYTNRLPLAINADGTLYNGGQGWKTNTRLNSSGAESTSSADGIEVTGFIPVKSGDKIYLENIVMNTGTKADKTYMWLYDSNFTKLDGRYRLFSQYGSAFDTQKNQGLIATDENGNVTMLTIDHDVFYTGSSHADLSKAAYLRISCEEINTDSIITVNEPIV